VSQSLTMSLAGLDLVAISRCLSQVVERDGDLVDAFFERQEVVELPQDERAAGVSLRREEGAAVRLSRGRETWLATCDGFDSERFYSALRQVARSWPQATYPAPEMAVDPLESLDAATEVHRFPTQLTRALRQLLVAFPMNVRVRRHRRWIQVVGPQVIPEAEKESFYSIEVRTPWTTLGRLATQLGESTATAVAESLCDAFHAREAAPPAAGESALVFSAQATAILLHEAVAHALEADTLAAGGRVEAAIGLQMGPSSLSVLDDPGSAPTPVRRSTDDEGQTVTRRWLLRQGVVEQPLADSAWSEISGAVVPGAARRGDRNDPPSPRSSHLLLLPGEATVESLLGEPALWVPEVSRGSLDVQTGMCRLHVPFGYRIEAGELGEPVGGFSIEGRVADLLGSVEAIGENPVETGAGWCAKGRRRVPVWATTPPLRLSRARVGS
jgi:hypothetical protein